MTRVWRSLAVVHLLLIGALVLLIQGTGWDDNGHLQALLNAPDCTAPCFLGIQPGTTTAVEAYGLLQAHPYVLAVNQASTISDNRLTWRWNGQQPTLLRTPFLDAGELDVQGGLVWSIKVRTAIPFAYVWLTLGQPQSGFTRPSKTYLGRLANHLARYASQGMTVQTLVSYPPLMDNFWNAPTDLIFNTTSATGGLYEAPCWLRCG